MPRLTVWMVRAALLHLGAGFTFGALMLLNKGAPVSGEIWRLLWPHVELVLLGWTLQLGMGVAFWIMPRFSGERRYGRVWLGWAAFGLLNAGVVTVIGGQCGRDGWPGRGRPRAGGPGGGGLRPAPVAAHQAAGRPGGRSVAPGSAAIPRQRDNSR